MAKYEQLIPFRPKLSKLVLFGDKQNNLPKTFYTHHSTAN